MTDENEPRRRTESDMGKFCILLILLFKLRVLKNFFFQIDVIQVNKACKELEQSGTENDSPNDALRTPSRSGPKRFSEYNSARKVFLFSFGVFSEVRK